jgi:Lrp/AsnC family transcriptional regulator for asnA, asnC and gidA
MSIFVKKLAMTSKNGPPELDAIDTQLLTILAQDARLSYADMGKKLFMSQGAVHSRVKKLMDAKLIKVISAELDYAMLGFDVTAFLGIYLEKSNMYDFVKAEMKKIPEIVDAHYTTGTYSIFAKVICRDTDHLRDILANKIQNINGIQRTETFISLEETLARPLLLAKID